MKTFKDFKVIFLILLFSIINHHQHIMSSYEVGHQNNPSASVLTPLAQKVKHIKICPPLCRLNRFNADSKQKKKKKKNSRWFDNYLDNYHRHKENKQVILCVFFTENIVHHFVLISLHNFKYTSIHIHGKSLPGLRVTLMGHVWKLYMHATFLT